MPPVPVVTAILNSRDTLKPQPPVEDAHLIAFLDAPATCPGWTIRPACSASPDPVRNARNHKVLLHRWLPDATYSLWIDGSILFKPDISLTTLTDLYLKDTDLAVFPHRTRSCIYEESLACIAQQKDDPSLIERQMARLRAEGYPPSNGLAETSVVLRRHTPAMAAFSELWWDEIVRGSRRDQLSFDYAAWKTGLRYTRFPGTLAANQFCIRRSHDGRVTAPEPH